MPKFKMWRSENSIKIFKFLNWLTVCLIRISRPGHCALTEGINVWGNLGVSLKIQISQINKQKLCKSDGGWIKPVIFLLGISNSLQNLWFIWEKRNTKLFEEENSLTSYQIITSLPFSGWPPRQKRIDWW